MAKNIIGIANEKNPLLLIKNICIDNLESNYSSKLAQLLFI